MISGEAAKYYDSEIVSDKMRGVLCVDFFEGEEVLASASFFGGERNVIYEV